MTDLRAFPAAALASTAPAFTPPDLDGLWGWWDASQIVGVSDGAEVAQWNDLSGNDRHAIGAAGARPLLRVGAQNAKSVVRFDGANDVLVVTPGAALAQPCTIFVVARPTRGASADEGLVSGAAGGVWIYGWTGGAFRLMSNTNFAWKAVGKKDGAFHLIAATLTNGGTSEIRVDSTLANGDVLSATSFPALYFGAGLAAADSFLAGDLAEIIVYNRALTAAERQQVEAYLA
ncbi:MAG: hypothetical protein JWR63_4295 [Conexibacter sp.]|nr:hypothetical protein [Conexibacter sp.]